MTQWWESLSILEKSFYFCAIPSTLILIIQTIMTIIGLGGDADMDFDGDMEVETSFDSDSAVDAELDDTAGLKFFSVRGFIAFFTVFGWTGAALSNREISSFIVVFIASVAGIISMYAIALMFASIMKLQSSGNININNSIGKTGTVYIPIPADNMGNGKIQIVIQERLREFPAITYDKETLKTGEKVLVNGVISNSVLNVSRIK